MFPLLFIMLSSDALAVDPPAAAPRNVLLVIADDMGVDKVGVYATVDYPDYAAAAADTLPVTPTLDGLAAAGVRFTNAWSNPTCSPTRAAAFSGRHGFRTGVGEAAGGADRPVLELMETTFAEQIQGGDALDRGYATGLFGKWHLGNALDRPGEFSDDVAREQGFDVYRGALDNTQTSYYDFDKVVDGVWLDEAVTTYITQDTFDDTLEWISAQTTPWIATIALQAPHSVRGDASYEAPPASCLSEGFDETLDPTLDAPLYYKAMVECLDAELANLLASLDADTLDRTTIIFVGDNGTDGAVVHDAFVSEGSKGTLYEGGVHVPFIIADGYYLTEERTLRSGHALGAVRSPGRVESTPVHVVDLFATMTSIAGVEGVEGVDSVNLVPLLTSTSVGLERSVIYTESFGLSHTADEPTNIGSAALRNRRFKMTSRVTYPVDPCVDSFEYSNPSFYDLGHDPAESQDLLAHPMTDRMQENYDILHTNMMDLHQSWLNEGCEG